MLKSFKYRIYPTVEQIEIIQKQFSCCRYIYNWGLQRKIEAYAANKTNLRCFDLIKEATNLKRTSLPWLKEAYSQTLQMSLRNLDNAFTRFFREKKIFPKFKSKKHPAQSCQYPQGVKFGDDAVYLPKVGNVRLILHRLFVGKEKTITLSRTASGKYFVSVLVEDGKPIPPKKRFTAKTTIGIDVGLKHFATLSTCEKIDNPKHLRKAEKRLKRLQHRMNAKKKGSKNRNKARIGLARQYEKVTNRRNDFLHKLSHRLVCENQAIAIETLNVQGMMASHRLAKNIGDSAWSTFFRFLDYKSAWNGKTLLEIGMFEASSKTCHICGKVNHELTLRDRKWVCDGCKTNHDRDVNAAMNIKSFALVKQNLIVPRDTRELTLGEIT